VKKPQDFRQDFVYFEAMQDMVNFRQLISNDIIDYIKPGKYPVDNRPEH
jgi:hypothetical protein